jgi:hypothetical protein
VAHVTNHGIFVGIVTTLSAIATRLDHVCKLKGFSLLSLLVAPFFWLCYQ